LERAPALFFSDVKTGPVRRKNLSSAGGTARHSIELPQKIMSAKPAAPTYMFVFRNPANQPDPSPAEMQKTFEKWMTWIKGMKAKGQYLAGDPLEDTPAKVLRGPRGKSVTDGPFAEAKEVVAGYMLIAAKDFKEALEIAKNCPAYERNGTVEVRQIMPIPV
jgi:hypothetical protein